MPQKTKAPATFRQGEPLQVERETVLFGRNIIVSTSSGFALQHRLFVNHPWAIVSERIHRALPKGRNRDIVHSFRRQAEDYFRRVAEARRQREDFTMKKKLDAYRGRLTTAQIAQGMSAAAKNAQRLAGDAVALLEAHRFPTAASLAILSIEESGKISILRSLSLATRSDEVSDAWKDYRSHTQKNVAWLLPQLVAAGARKLDDLRPLFDQDSDHPYVLDQIKQLGFYTDCLGQAHWSTPDATIDKDLAKMLVKVATVLAGKREYTKTEVDLWVEHIGPVWKKEHALMKQALVSWYAAMQKSGLAPEGANEMEQFVREGLSKIGAGRRDLMH